MEGHAHIMCDAIFQAGKHAVLDGAITQCNVMSQVRKLTSSELLEVLDGPLTCGDLQRVFARALRDGVEGWILGRIELIVPSGCPVKTC